MNLSPCKAYCNSFSQVSYDCVIVMFTPSIASRKFPNSFLDRNKANSDDAIHTMFTLHYHYSLDRNKANGLHTLIQSTHVKQ